MSRQRAHAICDCSARAGERPGGPIRLLTHPRYWGYGFNPVSFYYVFEPDGSRVRWVVADVANTPWNERHSYLLGPLGALDQAGNWRPECRKVFHVSPFMEMDQRYRWLLRPPGDSLLVNIENLGRELAGQCHADRSGDGSDEPGGDDQPAAKLLPAVERQHHEVATAGQAEIDVRFDSLVVMGDKMLTYKYVIKNVASRRGKLATFRPKVVFG